MSADLFGNVDPPPKGGPDYLQWLNDLELPDGLTFDSISANSFPPGVPQKYVENLWCKDRDGRFVHLVLDLRTGAKYEGERAEGVRVTSDLLTSNQRLPTGIPTGNKGSSPQKGEGT